MPTPSGSDPLTGPSATLETLRRRSVLLSAVRAFFTSQGYWEVETPILSRDTCVDAWLNPFSVPWGNRQPGYLQTSPEFALKRLMAHGAGRVFEIARVFRQDEVGVRHNPEFTMIEWYAEQTDDHAQMDLVENLVTSLAKSASNWSRRAAELPDRFQRLTYDQAFIESIGLSPGTASLEQLHQAALATGQTLPAGLDADRDGLLNFLLTECVEPELKRRRWVFVYDFPASQAALARVRPDPVPVAERFELYLDGMEICNGYHELTDADELLSRMRQQNTLRRQAGLPPLPESSRLLEAMRSPGLPDCSGVALGFDRLLMWCLQRTSIQQVLAFPFDRA